MHSSPLVACLLRTKCLAVTEDSGARMGSQNTESRFGSKDDCILGYYTGIMEMNMETTGIKGIIYGLITLYNMSGTI